MTDIAGAIQRLEKIEARLTSLEKEVAIAGADLCAQIANRVINTGESAKGGKFTPYSTKEVPAFWYRGRSVNATGEAKVRAAEKARKGVSYKDFREFNGRPTAFKNFSFTQEMWRGFGVKKVSYSGGVYTLTIGGKTKESAERIGYMDGQEGQSVIAPTRQETENAAKYLLKRILA